MRVRARATGPSHTTRGWLLANRPGSRIPIVAENRLRLERPDYVIILPWNLRDEISQQLSYVRDWGGQFVTAVPSLRIC